MATKKTTALATVEGFQIADRYEGMDPELLAELQDELGDLDEENGIVCRQIKIPAGGKLAYEVQGEEEGDEEYLKEIDCVIVFTHRMNGFWPNPFGSSDDGDKAPVCSSMDGKSALWRDTGELRTCENCPMNEFGSATDQAGAQAKGKACKNMRRLYLMMSGDPNLYLLTVPPTSIKEVNKQLARVIAGGTPYTGLVVTLKLEKTKNVGGIDYSKVIITKKGLLDPVTSAMAQKLRRQIKEQYQTMAVSLDDYAAAPAQGGQAAEMASAEFTEVTDAGDPELPFN